MKHITDTRVVLRKVTTTRAQNLIVMLAPQGIAFREPRRRTWYWLPYGVAYQQAAALHGAAERAHRAAQRRARRRA